MIDLPPPSYEQTIQAVEHCGVTRTNIRIKYEDYLRSDEVTISDIGEVTNGKLRCIRKAVHPFYILTLERSEQQTAFHELAREDNRPEQARKAREWAQSRGKTAEIPVFSEAEGVGSFVLALEHSCDLKPGSVFVDKESRFIALNPKFFSASRFRQSSKVLECFMQMFAASNGEDHGFRFGIIGNEAVVEEKK